MERGERHTPVSARFLSLRPLPLLRLTLCGNGQQHLFNGLSLLLDVHGLPRLAERAIDPVRGAEGPARYGEPSGPS